MVLSFYVSTEAALTKLLWVVRSENPSTRYLQHKDTQRRPFRRAHRHRTVLKCREKRTTPEMRGNFAFSWIVKGPRKIHICISVLLLHGEVMFLIFFSCIFVCSADSWNRYASTLHTAVHKSVRSSVYSYSSENPETGFDFLTRKKVNYRLHSVMFPPKTFKPDTWIRLRFDFQLRVTKMELCSD